MKTSDLMAVNMLADKHFRMRSAIGALVYALDCVDPKVVVRTVRIQVNGHNIEADRDIAALCLSAMRDDLRHIEEEGRALGITEFNENEEA